MITKINKIKNLGIFSNFPGISEDFGKYNLFYGWNGSGKTTLSNLFYGLQEKTYSIEDYPNLEFTFVLDNGSQVDEKNFKSNSLGIHIFNEKFVYENINFSGVTKSILLISKENIDETKKFEDILKNNKSSALLLEKEKKELEELKQKIESELTKKAKEIKLSFQTIDTKDTRYLNYDKTKLKSFLTENSIKCKNGGSILDEKSLKDLIAIIKPNDKSKVEFIIRDISLENILEIERRIVKILETNVTTGIIERLKNHSDISSWIEQGLIIQEKHGETHCEFCGNNILSSRLEQLRKHFSEEVIDLRKKLSDVKNYLNEKVLITQINFDKNYLYSDLQENFSEQLLKINKEINAINNSFNEWLLKVDEKIKNPAGEIKGLGNISNDFLDNYLLYKKNLENLINDHNKRFSDFDTELKKNQGKLEIHYASDFEKDGDYFNSLKKNISKEQEIENQKSTLNSELIKENDLKLKLSNETFGATAFNQKLSKFIGHNEINLIFNKEKNGYEIIRVSSRKIATNLSEGEKTAIAFVYFITKLQEKSSLNNEIIFIDDPISSFDSNNIFSAYSFIKAELDTTVNQIFISTHNFTFFKLVRDWFQGKNNKKDGSGNFIIKSKFYQIEANSLFPRESSINIACPSIINYNSEYHFIFYKIYSYKANSTLDLEKSFQIATLSRKLLESFLSFKFPKKRNDFRVLLQLAVNSVDESLLPMSDSIQFEEKIFKFINKYSHLQLISFGDDSENNQLGESDNIIVDILKLMEWIDKKHYDELVEICT